VVLPALYLLSTSLQQSFAAPNATTLKGPCPSCATEQLSPLVRHLHSVWQTGSNVVECSSCKADLTYDLNKRVIVVDKTPEEKQASIAAAAAAKKAAAAAKKAAIAAKRKAVLEVVQLRRVHRRQQPSDGSGAEVRLEAGAEHGEDGVGCGDQQHLAWMTLSVAVLIRW